MSAITTPKRPTLEGVRVCGLPLHIAVVFMRRLGRRGGDGNRVSLRAIGTPFLHMFCR